MDVYVPPADAGDAGCSGGCGTATDARYQYLQGYFGAHMLSMSSHRYPYITWIALAIVIAFIAAFHHSGIADQSTLGALWSRWAVRKRVIKFGRRQAGRDASFSDARKSKLVQNVKGPGRRKVLTFPSFGRTLLLLALLVVPVVLTIIGADYIRPTAGVFDMSESWPNSSISIYTPGLSRRLEWGRGRFPSVTTQAPSITLPYRTWWTAGGRTGAMTNALTPFVVIVALKQIPFALLSTRLLGGYAFDRLSFMHKWGGRVVWLFATAHVVLWSVQLHEDQAFGDSMWGIVFLWTKFRWGFVSYGFFTLLILLSLGPMRADHYEVFYICHVVCVIGFMVTAWIHHPPLGAWMYVTLLWWLAERITRLIKVAYINGIGFTGRRPQVVMQTEHGMPGKAFSTSVASSHTLHGSYPPSQLKNAYGEEHYFEVGPQAAAGDRRMTRKSERYDAVSDVIEDYAANQPGIMLQSMDSGRVQKYALEDAPAAQQSNTGHWSDDRESASPPGSSKHCASDYYAQSAQQHHKAGRPNHSVGSDSTFAAMMSGSRMGPRPAMAADVAAVIRPGFAYAQLLPGKTLRLTLRTPNAFAWLPGQYVKLSIPAVRFWQSHPFTIASAYNAGFPSSTSFQEHEAEKGLMKKARGEERTIVLILRARGGFTNHLWEYVRQQRERQIRAIEERTGQQYIRGEVAKTATGVHLRAIIDGPYGSVQRVRWGIHSTVVIICGGSGISSGMSILEYLCTAMVGAKQVRGFKTQRVRFVWMLREYSHLQWIASALRRCIEIVPPELLQVELYVTKIPRQAVAAVYGRGGLSPAASSLGLNVPPDHDGRKRSMDDPGWSHDEGLNQARFTEGDDQDEYDIDAYDLTQFDGEDNSGPSAAEARINERVAKEGKLRRAHTRKATLKRTARRGGQTKGPPTGLPQPLSALAHQRAVYESDKAAIPERDLGTAAGEHDDFERQADADHPLAPPPFRTADGFLQPRGYPSQDHLNTPWSGPPTPALMSPQMSPRLAPSEGRQTPGEPSSSVHGFDYSSTTHLHQPNTPLSGSRSEYVGGENLTPMASEVDVPIDMDEDENADLHVVAELARPGYPKLDVILREEARQAAGRVLVSACGPSSLGDLIRSIASKQINVAEIRKGHLNAHINVVTESYEWGG